ncbi:MAG: SDR family NAD(P)-dependent oxidoreductase [Bacillota bacterium]|nr:SDR family NAD(P)-dependent oxidoreductase [Bacillota bacterium]
MNVLITGAAGGLGRAFANECAKRGYKLILTDINESGLNAIKSGIERKYSTSVIIKSCDLTSDNSVDEFMEFVRYEKLQFDMLLNIAGVDYEGGFMERDINSVLKILKLNLEATLRITHKVLEERNGKSRFYIIFVSSLASLYPMPLKATYAASKRFLLDFSYALREELKSENVSVLSLCPGGLATTKEAISGITAQGFYGDITTNPLERVVHKTISRSLSNKALYVPGLLNRALSILGNIVPRKIITRLLYSRWTQAQKQWLNTN